MVAIVTAESRTARYESIYKDESEMLMKINQLASQLQKLGAMGKNLKSDKVILRH